MWETSYPSPVRGMKKKSDSFWGEETANFCDGMMVFVFSICISHEARTVIVVVNITNNTTN